MRKGLGKKILLALLIVLLLSGGIIGYLLYDLSKALNPDPIYNTRYTSNYKEYNFDKVKIGNRYDNVIDLLGCPLKIDTITFVEQFLYTNFPDDVFFIEGSDGLRFNGGNDSLRYSNISLDKQGKVIGVFSDFKLGDKSKDEIMLFSKNSLIELFDIPQKQMICDCNCIVLSYSTLKEGPYRGKHPIIDLRKILIMDSIVVRKVKKEGNPFNRYLGTCTILKN